MSLKKKHQRCQNGSNNYYYEVGIELGFPRKLFVHINL